MGRALTLERNLALMAGAGAGKTYSLVTICLHLLSGARRGAEPIACSELCLLTFTDKAAGELRARLRERLERLATGRAGADDELDLRASFAELGRPFPDEGFWRRVRDELGAATIGTFHSLCVQLLRRAPGGFGVDPAFELLDERDAASLVRETAERVVLDALEAGEQPAVELCRELGFGAFGRVEGLVGALARVFGKVREEGVSPADVRVADEPQLREALERARLDLGAVVEEAFGALTPKQLRFRPLLEVCREALAGMSAENFLEPDRFPKMRRAVEAESGLSSQSTGAGPALKQVRWRVLGSSDRDIVGMGEWYAAWALVPHERAFLALLGRLEARHREELARRGALDFSELLIRTRDLLRDWPGVRAEIQERFRALLVDEFQDTNRLQLELVTLLSERREGAPRPVEGSGVLELPLEPAFLCAVGDRKQSIYEFRGADVSVFALLAAKITQEEGTQEYLRQNRRSSPPLLDFFNRLFASVMRAGPDPQPYEVAYDPEGDDLSPHREALLPGPAVLRLVHSPSEEDDAESCRQVDADAVGRWIAGLLAEEGLPEEARAADPTGASTALGPSEIEGRVSDQRGGRVRGGDVAILFRRFTHLETYRQALTRYGVPHRVIRGRGFYGAQEVLDLASLLALIADPGDAVALAAVLRSPLVALSDGSLFQLAQATGGVLQPKRVLRGDPSELGLSGDEAARLQRFVRLYPLLQREKDRIGIRSLLKVALEELGYRIAVAGTPFGEQALANLDKLLELAGRWDAAGTGDCAGFAREVLALADRDPTEAQAEILDAQDPRAVQLLTIHQAKGLEWPIVVVPDLGAQRKTTHERITFDRQLGLAIRPWLGDEGITRSPRIRDVAGAVDRRERAEFKRLLYVALTRARDRLVLSGASRARDTWWEMIDRALAEHASVRALVADIPVEALPPASVVPAPVPAPAPTEGARVERALERVREVPQVSARTAVFPVTHLQDFSRCPRRYAYAHQIGLAEYPAVFELDEDSGSGRDPRDSRQRGTMVHRLLERVNLSALGTDRVRPELEALLWSEGMDPASEDAREILSWAEGFLATPFAARLAAAEPSRIHRELPFVLRLGGEGLAVHLKGQIDLLFEAEDGSALVIDYKASKRPPEGLGSYAFQLDCYALAARELVRDGVPVRTGIAFLRERDPGPDLRADGLADRRAFEEKLRALATDILARTARQDWPGRDLPECQALGCGYVYRCHHFGPR